jgi:PAS domain S-box-containing protein
VKRGLFLKYVVLIVGLVTGVLVINAALDLYFVYQDNRRASIEVQKEKAEAAAQRIESFVREIERQVGWVAQAQWAALPVEQRRFDYARLLRQVPAITELVQLDRQGHEQLLVSRFSMEVVGAGTDRSTEPAFVEAMANRVYFSPVYFHQESEPYLTMAIAHGGKSGVTIAEVNLMLIWDVVSQIKVGKEGYAYVVDRMGRLVAHPDISLVLRGTDMSRLAQVAAALKPRGQDAGTVDASSRAGVSVLSASAPIPALGWLVFVEVPTVEAQQPVIDTGLRALGLLVLGLLIAGGAGALLARRMVVPIRAMQAGAERIGAGELNHRLAIKTGDELESLAEQFNRTAAALEESHAGLEQKVEDRTAELRESLDQQTATAEVLRAISQSPTDVQPVLRTVTAAARRFCGATDALIALRDEAESVIAAQDGPLTASVGRRRPLSRDSLTGRAMLDGLTVHAPDTALLDPKEYAAALAMAREHKWRAAVAAPMLREGVATGAILLRKTEPGAFTPRQIELLETFAAQAVIAIENARLFTDLRESLEQQTATAEVLQVISSSPGNLAPVFDAMLEKATELCEAKFGCLFLYDGKAFTVVADRNLPPAYAQMVRGQPLSADSNIAFRQMVENKAPQHLTDMFADGAYSKGEPLRTASVELGGVRSMIALPLLNKGELIGNLTIYKGEPGGFPENQISLVTTFANQAVIAIENARLFGELRERQAELRVTFDNMGDGVAMFDGELRLAAWNRNLQQILDLPDALLVGRPSYADYLRTLAERGEFGTDDVEAELNRRLENTDQELRMERIRPDGTVIEVRRSAVPGGGFVLIYADITERKRAEAEISKARDAAETALRDLQTAQASLLHSQKMASLGQLTAGIAHEIKNPLNFVNNFAGLSVELLDELKEIAGPVLAGMGENARAEFGETIEMIASNLDKIAEHGKRADGIVKSMLSHSRGGTGDWQESNINALVEEALNLAYHGARAQDREFNVTLERDFTAAIKPIELVPQEVTRVFLNLFGNGFYATQKRHAGGADPGYRPTLTVSTRDLGEAVEVRVRDNGTGIPPDVRDKLFQPFFTTKPTGEGTGLGLSISYDIVTQQHGGTIEVESELGVFTEFAVRLPRRRRAARSRGT